MLWRALQHIENGFYIDIGAQDPVVDSVSLAFYEHGWRGVHVEPTRQYSEKISSARPDEVVEQVAIGSLEGSLVFYEFNDTGLSTADAETAERHIASGFKAVKTEVPVVTLDHLLEKQKDEAIHWMKIDVEGMEKEVLQSWKSSEKRPWILVIESTKPTTNEESHQAWEQIVLDKGYVYAYFDGLNRFYVHMSQSALLASFRIPPNIFDDFLLSGYASQPFYKGIKERARQAEARQLQKVAQLEEEGWRLQLEIRELQARFEAVITSSSWKLTAPFRKAAHALKNCLTFKGHR